MEKSRKYGGDRESSFSKVASRRAISRGAAAQQQTAAVIDINEFKGAFSFDKFFNSLVGDIMPSAASLSDDASDAAASSAASYATSSSGSSSAAPMAAGFPESEGLLPRFKDARKELLDMSRKVEDKLGKLRKEVAVQDAEHKETLVKLERGVEGLFDSFGRLDARISGVGQTAARIGDHLQSADAQRESTKQIIKLVKYLMDFNSSREDLMQFAPPAAVFSDDQQMGEAAMLASKLRALAEEDEESGDFVHGGDGRRAGPSASPGLEVAVQNLQEYCNDLENKLLQKFDEAAAKRDLQSMAECAKTLEQFQRGSRAMHRYVQTRPMFLDVEVMTSDIRVAMGETGASIANVAVNNPTRGLSNLYRQIIDTMKEESSVVAVVFPSPKTVMALLTQRVLEQRVQNVLDHLLVEPNVDAPPPLQSGGLQSYLRMLAASYEKTMDLAKQLQDVGCGDLDVEGLAEDLFSSHRRIYDKVEHASLMQLFEDKLPLELATLDSAPSSSSASSLSPLSRNRGTSPQPAASDPSGLVAECVRWNEEAVARCKILTPESGPLVENVSVIFSVLLLQVSIFTMTCLDKANKALNEAAALRDKFSISTAVSRRVAQAAATATEQAALAGEQSIRTFMKAVKRATSNASAVHNHFVNTVARVLLAVDGAHAKCTEEMQRKLGEAEEAALQGLIMCMSTAMSEVDRLLQAEQKTAEFKSPDDGALPDHRPTSACIKVKSYLERVVESVQGGLEGPNRTAFLSELGIRLHASLLVHIKNFTFSPSGGLRLKRDVSEYADFVRTFKAPQVDELFESLSALVNLFIVAPESLRTLVDTNHMSHKDALVYIQLRDDYKSARIASFFAK